LHIFCGEFLLGARLRSSNIDTSAGRVAELQRIEILAAKYGVPAHHDPTWGHAGICSTMAWCEANRAEYLLGSMARNLERLGLKASWTNIHGLKTYR
jgi:hypothetical protein